MNLTTAIVLGGIAGHFFGWPGIIVAGLLAYFA